MKVIERLVSWGEVSARIWAEHWLLIVGSCLVAGSTLLKWVEFPFSRNLIGLQMPFWGEVGLIPHLTPFSFGFFGLLVLLAGLLFFRVSVAFMGAAAAVLLTVFVLVPAHIAFEQPALLDRLTEETTVMPLIKTFTRRYLPQNYGAPEDIPKHFSLDSGWGRFSAATLFLGPGWYGFGLGALLLGGYAATRMRGQSTLMVLALLGLPGAALGIVLTPAILGQHYFTRASLAKAEGRNDAAIADFRKAMRWDAWHRQDVYLYGTIGELQRLADEAGQSPERAINRALQLKDEKQYEPAIFELGNAAKAGGALGRAARRETAGIQVAFGLALYQAGGAGSAVHHWQQALAEDPMQVYVLPYLARGYFDIGSYQAAVQIVDQLRKIVRDHSSLLGDAYSLGGDAYAKLGRDTEARRYYSLSLAADPAENYWALTGLTGE